MKNYQFLEVDRLRFKTHPKWARVSTLIERINADFTFLENGLFAQETKDFPKFVRIGEAVRDALFKNLDLLFEGIEHDNLHDRVAELIFHRSKRFYKICNKQLES